MSWQEELRKLDEELAAGRISADDYRVRRDQVLASAVSASGQPEAQSSSLGEATHMMRPVDQPPAPRPPADEANGAPGTDSDKTQIVPDQGPADGDRTQAVGGWQTARPQGDDAERTQIVPGVPPQSHSGGQLRPPPGQPSPPMGFQQPQPGWQPHEELSPPWAGAEFPPLVATGTPDWIKQGPEVFEERGRSKTLRALGIAGLVVLLIGLAAGAYFLFRPDAGQPGATNTSEANPPTTATSTTKKPDGPPIADLPGQNSDTSKVKAFADVERVGYLTPQEIDIYKKGGAGESRMAISNEQDSRIIVLVTQETDKTTAATARDGLAELQLKFKMIERGASPGVLASGNDTVSGGPLRRAHYASGRYVVRVQVQGKNASAVDTLFDDVLAAQLELLPADD